MLATKGHLNQNRGVETPTKPSDAPSSEEPRPLTLAAPWLMLIGVSGIGAAVLGLPVPVLTCLLLVGLGADADLARRFAHFEAADVGHLATPIRTLHAAMYAGLYTLAWAAMANMAHGGFARTLLLTDLAASLVLLVVVTRWIRPVSVCD